nr:immunoglobulin heavy chain junction region [Mus musculus]
CARGPDDYDEGPFDYW